MKDKTIILHVTDNGDSLQLSKDRSEYVINNISGRNFAKLVHKTVCDVQEAWDEAEDTDAANINSWVENAILKHFKLGNRCERVRDQLAPVMLVIDQPILEQMETRNILFPTVDSTKELLEDMDKDMYGAICYSVYHQDRGSNGYYSLKYKEFRSI